MMCRSLFAAVFTAMCAFAVRADAVLVGGVRVVENDAKANVLNMENDASFVCRYAPNAIAAKYT